MIFALKNSNSSARIQFEIKPNLDVFCFFSCTDAVSIPEREWFNAVLASLKLGREVLILEEIPNSWPELNFSSRWEVGDNWTWLAPRSRRVLSETYTHFSTDLISIKQSLRSSK